MKTRLILPALAALLLAAAPAFAEDGMMGHKGHAGMGKHLECPEQVKGVKTEKKAVKNGIEITMTAETPEAAAEVREKAAAHYGAKDCPLLKDAAGVDIENIENGVKVTITAGKPAAVRKLQATVKKGHTCCGAGGQGKDAAGKAVKKGARYVCPMGDYEGDKPGKCPKCGMTLVEKK